MIIHRADYELPSAFYLGRDCDPRGNLHDSLTLYDSRDLVTHGVVLGMTGSGKTGLCISLLEEAMMDNIPAIVIDPKGDIANLMLTFPGLSAAEFEPWVNPDDAARAGTSVAQFAQREADRWRRGLADWGQPPERIRELRKRADVRIYTPGSTAGIPVSVLGSLQAPEAAVRQDSELLAEAISSTAASLLGLIGVDADPVQSREHILLASILGQSWSRGQDLDLGSLIQAVHQPPIDKIGVMDVESFFPVGQRSALAMRINSLLAAPGFAAWMQGAPLDIKRFLYDPSGKPQVAIFSIAHLSDSERMFFVSLLLNRTLGWMRTQPGTNSLRALLYMDEIYGYLPPVGNPPSKPPMMTLLKQGRAFGLGLLLATQNPVDLDYKALSNIGTWFLGRLQTERDKARVLDGLEGTSLGEGASFSRSEIDRLLSGLDSRVFLLNNVHEGAPCVFHVRWAMTYLRGPLTRDQIRSLMAEHQPAESANEPVAKAGGQPVVPRDIPQYFLRVKGLPDDIVYLPAALRCADVAFEREVRKLCQVARIRSERVDWAHRSDLDCSPDELDRVPAAGIEFGELPAFAMQSATMKQWAAEFADEIYRSFSIDILRSPQLDQSSNPGESEADFRARLTLEAREVRDAKVAKLRAKYARRLKTLEDRIERAEAAVEREKLQATQSKMSTLISMGAALLTAFMGRSAIGRASSTARSASRSWKQGKDVDLAEEKVEGLQEELAAMQAELEQEIAEIQASIDPASETFERIPKSPAKKDIDVTTVGLAWLPYRRLGDEVEAAWRT
jgi:hypothetical protein